MKCAGVVGRQGVMRVYFFLKHYALHVTMQSGVSRQPPSARGFVRMASIMESSIGTLQELNSSLKTYQKRP